MVRTMHRGVPTEAEYVHARWPVRWRVPWRRLDAGLTAETVATLWGINAFMQRTGGLDDQRIRLSGGRRRPIGGYGVRERKSGHRRIWPLLLPPLTCGGRLAIGVSRPAAG